MSLRMWHIDPASGTYVLWVPASADLPAPFVWKFGAEGCINYNAEIENLQLEQGSLISEISDAKATPFGGLHGTAAAIQRLSALAFCESREFTYNMNIAPNWFDITGPQDPTIITMTERTTDGQTASLSLTVQNRGHNPPPSALSAALGNDTLRALCWQESRWRQFNEDGTPIKNVNANGTIDWGCMQINQANNRQVWHWPSNVSAAQALLSDKQNAARAWLNKHPPFSEDMLQRETIQRYNGGAYYMWDDTGKKWVAHPPNGYVASVLEIIAKKPWPS